MIQPSVIATASGDRGLVGLAAPLPLAELCPGDGNGGEWEVEVGFGKGRYLLRRCQESPEGRFLGVEIAAEYHKMFVERARKRGLANWIAIRGEALSLLAAVLPRGFAAGVHVYFPDPWPKSRHQKRRLFDPETVDLVVGLLRPGGRLSFATDFLEYGALVEEILRGYPGLAIRKLDAWPEGPRTNYEAKYEVEGRPILRLEGILEGPAVLHPAGAREVLVGPRLVEEKDIKDDKDEDA